MWFTIRYWCGRSQTWREEEIGPCTASQAHAVAEQAYQSRRATVQLYNSDGQLIWYRV